MEVDGIRVRRMGMTGRRRESESILLGQDMCLEGGERIDSSMKSYLLRKVMDKWREDGCDKNTMFIVSMHDGLLLYLHYKNKLVVLTTEWYTLVADKLERQWLWGGSLLVLKARYKTWTLNSGLDYGMDYVLDFGLDLAFQGFLPSNY